MTGLPQRVRPTRLDDVVGNAPAVVSLRRFLAERSVPHAMLFVGASGCGKTTLARILATELGATGVDVLEMNAADLRGIDDAREIIRQSNYCPMQSAARVFILDEVHQATSAAQNALLKPIEDHSPTAYFFFCTTDPEKIIPTLRNRCTVVSVARLSEAEIRKVIDRACLMETLDVPNELREAVAIVSDGCPRVALVKLEQIAGVGDCDAAYELLCRETEYQEEVVQLCRLLVADAPVSWDRLVSCYKSLKVADSEKSRRAILGYLSKCLLSAKDPRRVSRFAELIRCFESSTFYSGEPGLARMLFDAFRANSGT